MDTVARGVAWLDQNIPGWERKVNLDTLDQRSARMCVLSQAMGCRYVEALDAHNLSIAAGAMHGFSTFHQSKGAYPALTAEWRRVIAERLGVQAPAAPAPADSMMTMTREEVKRWMKLLDKTGVDALEVTHQGVKLRITK